MQFPLKPKKVITFWEFLPQIMCKIFTIPMSSFKEVSVKYVQHPILNMDAIFF